MRPICHVMVKVTYYVVDSARLGNGLKFEASTFGFNIFTHKKQQHKHEFVQKITGIDYPNSLHDDGAFGVVGLTFWNAGRGQKRKTLF